MTSVFETNVIKMSPTSTVELNNNKFVEPETYKHERSLSAISCGSISSSSDQSEDTDTLLQDNHLRRDLALHLQDDQTPSSPDDRDSEGPGIKRGRSMSDGFSPVAPEYFEVFPSLPDSVLEKMGLLGDEPRERLNEEELEQKFVALALAFTIDAATIKDRCTRQRRYRDQTETNLVVEIERLVTKVNRLHPLCVDAETTELLTSLLYHVDVVLKASSLATISAERFGAVQHEQRLADSVHLMINHVTVLKQQRDSTRRQLQYTKRMLQDTSSNTNHNHHTSDTLSIRQRFPSAIAHSATGNNRLLTRRRASIATINTQQETTNGGGSGSPSPGNSRSPHAAEIRKFVRRTSELSLRGGAMVRCVRPVRLELGVDLVKIREGITIENVPPVLQEENENDISNPTHSDEEDDDHDIMSDSDFNSSRKNSDINLDSTKYPLRKRISNRLLKLRADSEDKLKTWMDSGTMHEMFCFCALMCFSLSIITMGNILIELECAKRGLPIPMLFWNLSGIWTTGNDAETTNRIYNAANT